MGFAKFEPGMRGPWPAKQYDQLVGCLGQIINSLALLSGAYGHMDRTWAKRLAENADTLHPSLVRLIRLSGHHLKWVADDRLPIDFVVLSAKMFSILYSLKRHYHPPPKSQEKDERDNKQGRSSSSPCLSAMSVSPGSLSWAIANDQWYIL